MSRSDDRLPQSLPALCAAGAALCAVSVRRRDAGGRHRVGDVRAGLDGTRQDQGSHGQGVSVHHRAQSVPRSSAPQQAVRGSGRILARRISQPGNPDRAQSRTGSCNDGVAAVDGDRSRGAADAGSGRDAVRRDCRGLAFTRNDREGQGSSRAIEADESTRGVSGGGVMKVEREVIIDLLPAYFSGEASPATRALVEEYFREHPEFEKTARSANRPLESLRVPVAALDEAKAKLMFERARQITEIRSSMLWLAVCFTLMLGLFRIQDHKIVWIIWSKPSSGVIFACVAAFFWVYYLYSRRLKT